MANCPDNADGNHVFDQMVITHYSCPTHGFTRTHRCALCIAEVRYDCRCGQKGT